MGLQPVRWLRKLFVNCAVKLSVTFGADYLEPVEHLQLLLCIGLVVLRDGFLNEYYDLFILFSVCSYIPCSGKKCLRCVDNVERNSQMVIQRMNDLCGEHVFGYNPYTVNHLR